MAETFTIRSESIADTQAIAELNWCAFGDLVEPQIVALARQLSSYDPALSLVAERDGHVIGHALFLRQQMRLMGETIPAVSLGPIAVAPDIQKQGVGGALIEAGHALARERGYVMSFLLGHDTYYPRFGYRTRALIEAGHALARERGYVMSFLLGHDTYYPRFGYRTHQHGESHVEITQEMLKKVSSRHLQTRAPSEADIPALMALWEHEEGAVDFAIRPGESVFDWVSPNRLIDSVVWLKDGVIVGYTRVKETEPSKAICFMAMDAKTAQTMTKSLISVGRSFTLPLHPASASAVAFALQPVVTAWSAGMACPLVDGVLDVFTDSVARGERPAGRVIWSVLFEV